MMIHGLNRKLYRNDAVMKFFSRIADIKLKFNLYLAKVTDSKLFQLILEHKKPVSLFLYILWTTGCGYWLYQLMVIDAKPKPDLGLVLTDPRDALVILFFGTLGSFFVIFFVFFLIKLTSNLFHDGIESFFPARWHSLIKPASYLCILMFAFSFTGTIKTAGLTAYNQVAALFHTSMQHKVIVEKEMPDDLEKKLNGLIKMIGKDNQE